MWKDDAIDKHIVPIAEMLIDGCPELFMCVEFVGIVENGVEGVSAKVWISPDKKTGLSNFFDVASQLRDELRSFHKIFTDHGEPWKAINLKVKLDGSFEIDFEYKDPYKWDQKINRN